MKNKRGGMTAGELLAQLATDPEYQAVHEAKDREFAEIAEQRRKEQQPLLNDLSAAGVTVDSVHHLLQMQNLNERIYRVLLEHITKPYTPWLLEWIGRAFGHKTARPIIWDRLLGLIKSHVLEDRAVQGAMAAISDLARPKDLGSLIDLLSDTSLGSSRLFLVRNLMRSKRPEARSALIRFQADPDLTREITSRLRRRLV
ncbi:hypothetical protein [Sphingomonas sp.]|uniref:hypothetical protein n=1 Tax=Sphingomonas sp. TaxID=28214 RepID=UPI002DD62FBC|nr:hypothetical protein [Sphingomonas sp.]